VVRSVADKAVTKIRIGTVYPATIGVPPAFLARIGCKCEIELLIMFGMPAIDLCGSSDAGDFRGRPRRKSVTFAPRFHFYLSLRPTALLVLFSSPFGV
jgi:hypothetical protein